MEEWLTFGSLSAIRQTQKVKLIWYTKTKLRGR